MVVMVAQTSSMEVRVPVLVPTADTFKFNQDLVLGILVEMLPFPLVIPPPPLVLEALTYLQDHL